MSASTEVQEDPEVIDLQDAGVGFVGVDDSYDPALMEFTCKEINVGENVDLLPHAEG